MVLIYLEKPTMINCALSILPGMLTGNPKLIFWCQFVVFFFLEKNKWVEKEVEESMFSPRSWPRSGMCMEESRGKEWNLWRVFRELKEYYLAGGRSRHALSYSGRQIALRPGSYLSSLMGIYDGSWGSKLFSEVLRGAGCPPAKDAIEGNLTICEQLWISKFFETREVEIWCTTGPLPRGCSQNPWHP